MKRNSITTTLHICIFFLEWSWSMNKKDLQYISRHRHFDFFVLQKNENVISFENAGASVNGINYEYTNFDQRLEAGDFTFKSIKIITWN